VLLESASIAGKPYYFTFASFLELHDTCCPLFSSLQLPHLLLLKVTPELSAGYCFLLLAPSWFLATQLGNQSS